MRVVSCWVLGAANVANAAGFWVLLMLLGIGYWLSKEVVLGIDMRDGREPDEALVGASSLSS